VHLIKEKKYILADVTTKISFNDQTVVTFAGLEKTKSPSGERNSAAIKKAR
jgi:outer membrane protein insertion porin family